MPRIQTFLPPGLRLVIRLLLLLLLVNAVMRGVFFAYNLGQNEAGLGGGLVAFLVGLRFDLAALFLTNGLFFLLWMLPVKFLWSRWPIRIWPVLFAVVNSLVLLVNAMDVVYFGFSSKRMSYEPFSLGGDVANFGVDNFLPYWWLILIWLGLSFGLYRLARPWFQAHAQELWGYTAPRSSWMALVLAAGLMFLGIRGGFQARPLRPGNAFVTGDIFLGNVGLNSAYTILSALDISEMEPISLLPPEVARSTVQQQVRNRFDGPFYSAEYPLLRKTQFSGPERRHNVVLLILESFNAGAEGPFLDSLKQEGWFFPRFYANGARSVQSLPAILNSLPDLYKRPLIGSSFETNTHFGLGNILQSKGYHNSFFCGGQNGTMGFDAYCRISGIDNYYGQNEFKGEGARGNWGLHDRPFLEFMAREQAGFPEPFFTTFFSITNHHPFALPEDCPEWIRDQDLAPFEKTRLYTDWALRRYFEAIRSEPWFDNTIFVITADHCFFEPGESKRLLMESFHIPLMVVGPGIEPRVDHRIASHIDLQPTLIELLQLQTPHASLGLSLADTLNRPVAVHSMMDILELATDSLALETDFQDNKSLRVWKNGTWEWVNYAGQRDRLDHLLRAFYQLGGNLRLKNAICPPGLGK